MYKTAPLLICLLLRWWYKLINILKNYKLESLRIKFIVIYLLNITDIIFTLTLLRTGKFIEANGIMRQVIGNEILSIGIKALVPLVLFSIIYIRMQKATQKQLILSNRIINFCLLLYFLINISHFVWIFIITFNPNIL